MKTFNRGGLPITINYNKKTYVINIDKSHQHQSRKEFDKKGCVLVKVLHRNLKGKNDLHGQPYKPSEWIFAVRK